MPIYGMGTSGRKVKDPSPAYTFITGKGAAKMPGLTPAMTAAGYSIGPTGSISLPGYPGTGGGVASPAATLTGAPAFSYSSPYGGIPQVPNPIGTAGGAIAGNTANLPGALNLAGQVNQFSNQQAVNPYIANLPGYAGLLGQASQNASSLLQGQVPTDVWQQMIRGAAERGVGMGSPGSPNANAALMQALGTNSLALGQTGLANFQTLMGLTPVGQQFNPASMFVSPEQMQAAQTAANVYKAAPVPADKAAADLNAALAGLNAGRVSVSPGGYIPFPSGSATQMPAYTAQPTAPGVTAKPTGTGTAQQPSQVPSVQDLWNQAPYPGGENMTFPGMPDYPYVPGFESLPPQWAASQGAEPYYGPLAPGNSGASGAELMPGFESVGEGEYPGADASLQQIYDWLGV